MVGQIKFFRNRIWCGGDSDVASPDCVPPPGATSGPSCEDRVRAKSCVMEPGEEPRAKLQQV